MLYLIILTISLQLSTLRDRNYYIEHQCSWIVSNFHGAM